MTDAQEDEMAQWLKNHPEMYNKGKKEYRATMPSHLSTDFDPADKPVESGF